MRILPTLAYVSLGFATGPSVGHGSEEPATSYIAPYAVQPVSEPERESAAAVSDDAWPYGGTAAQAPYTIGDPRPDPYFINSRGESAASPSDASAATAAQAPADWAPSPAGEQVAAQGSCVTCVSGDLIEGEPDCFDGYVDMFNGGCNVTPNNFSTIDCGQAVCGRYGTYLSGTGSNFRDTDWYHFTLPAPATVTWTTVGEARTRVFILQGTCPATSLGTAVADPCQPATVTIPDLPAGTYSAFVGTDAFSGVPCGSQYRATLTIAPCCVGPCQPGDLIEGEPDCFDGYEDTFNAGCNVAPNNFGTIDCAQTVCGRYGTYLSNAGANFRDTDWYHFTLLEPANVTWTVVGEARTRVFILQGACPASSLATGVADPCQPATASVMNLAAGTYSAFVGTEAFSGIPCGTRYRATLTVEPCCVGPCEPGDLIEGEPDCFDGYVDAFNAGCNATPNHFSEITCGLTVCGKYGTYLSSGGANFRDTDWYHFTVTAPSNVTWTVVGEARTRVFILQGTCPASSLGTAVADPCQPATVVLSSLAPGTYSAFVGTDAFGGVPCGRRYRATLTVDPCCPVGCQPGDRVEGEPDCANGYVDTHNGGCNLTPNVFGVVEPGESVCGRYGTYVSSGGANFRDTDWYHFTLPGPTDVAWTAIGEVRTRVFILQGTCPASSLGTAVADPCQPATVMIPNLAAGTYSAFVGTEAFSGVACGSRYRATLTAGAGAPAATVTGAVSRKINSAGPGGACDLPLVPGVRSEPRTGGITELRIAFDVAPGGPGADPVDLDEKVCPAPGTYGPYTGASTVSATVEGNELVLNFSPGLENLRTYRIMFNANVTSLPGQFVEIRGLVGDANNDGFTNAVDRGFIVGAWTSPSGFSCSTDLDSNGSTNAVDRSLVVGAWTAPSNCAP